MATKKKKNSKGLWDKLAAVVFAEPGSTGYRNSRITMLKYTVVIIAVMAVVGPIISVVYAYGTMFERTVTIKERPYTGIQDEKRVKSTAGDWYMVGDAFYMLKFNSMDTWGNLEEGKTYKVKGFGWRMGFFSMFPNITEIQSEVK